MKRISIAAGAMLAVGVLPARAEMWRMPPGLYVRGDVGGGFGDNLGFTDTNPGAFNAFLGPGAGVAASTGNSVLIGAGLGIRITPAFRADATFDYLPSLTLTGSGTGAAVGFHGQADLNSAVALANLYLDLDGLYPKMFGPLQPYLTGGIGVASNTLGTVSAKSPGGVPLTLSGATHTDFAWGVGAGVAYALTEKLTLDASYKYLDLGSVLTGTTATGPAGSAAVTASKSGDLSVHTITLGVRYAF
jgi:opacity protein-like surface antigen